MLVNQVVGLKRILLLPPVKMITQTIPNKHTRKLIL